MLLMEGFILAKIIINIMDKYVVCASEGDPICHEWVLFQTKSRYPLNSNFHSCELLEVLSDKFKCGENKKIAFSEVFISHLPL